MLVFFKQRLVLLSMPKTGSTALHAALSDRADMVISGPPELKHAPLYRYNRFIRPMFEKVCGVELDVMALMREPVSWLGSWYRYRRRPQVVGRPVSTAELSFDAFVQGYCQAKQPAFARVGSQKKFLEPLPNGCHVSHLFAYEDTAGWQEFLSERLGHGVPILPELNVSPAAPLKLSASVDAELRQKYADTFDLYNSINQNVGKRT